MAANGTCWNDPCPQCLWGSAADTDCVQSSFVLSCCDPDAAVAPAWYSVGIAWQVVALSDMELGLPPETKTYASGEYGDMALLPYKKPIYIPLIL